jgi:N-acetylmuramoyl-L-alanine amidase
MGGFIMPTVGLDVGHGEDTFEDKHSKGLYNNNQKYEEHHFNSKLAIEIEKHLKIHGIQVKMIQKPFSDDVPLIVRTNYYNNEKVDLVWSIHANANGNTHVEGICCFYWHDHEQSKKAAEMFIDEVKASGHDTHGSGLHASERGSWTDLHITRETKMAAVLTENGFMTNPEDFEDIFGNNNTKYIKELAIIHAKAICRYFGVKFKGEVIVSGTVSFPEEVKEMKIADLINSGDLVRLETVYRHARFEGLLDSDEWEKKVGSGELNIGEVAYIEALLDHRRYVKQKEQIEALKKELAELKSK